MLPGYSARLIAGLEADAQVIELVRQQLGWISRCITSSGTISAMLCRGFWPVDGVASSVADEIASRFMPTLADHNQYRLGGDIWYGGGISPPSGVIVRRIDRSMTIAVSGSRFRHLRWGCFNSGILR